MKKSLRAALAAAMAWALAMAAGAQAQPAQPKQAQGGREKTVEEAYLQEAAELTMVRELSRQDDLEDKQLALDYARRAIEAGRKSDDLRGSLQYLALENTEVVARNAGLGPVANNFPDVRRQACILLGDFPSVATKDTLVRVIGNSKVEDPMVLAEAIRSLGKIGMNDNDEVVNAIAASVNHFANVGMSEDRLAVYTIYAFSDLADRGVVKDLTTVTDTVVKFTKGSYVSSVRNLALQTLAKLAQAQAKAQQAAKQ